MADLKKIFIAFAPSSFSEYSQADCHVLTD